MNAQPAIPDDQDTEECPCCAEPLTDAVYSEMFMAFIHRDCMSDCGEWT